MAKMLEHYKNGKQVIRVGFRQGRELQLTRRGHQLWVRIPQSYFSKGNWIKLIAPLELADPVKTCFNQLLGGEYFTIQPKDKDDLDWF